MTNIFSITFLAKKLKVFRKKNKTRSIRKSFGRRGCSELYANILKLPRKLRLIRYMRMADYDSLILSFGM